MEKSELVRGMVRRSSLLLLLLVLSGCSILFPEPPPPVTTTIPEVEPEPETRSPQWVRPWLTAAGVLALMITGLIVFLTFQDKLEGHGMPPDPQNLTRPAVGPAPAIM